MSRWRRTVCALFHHKDKVWKPYHHSWEFRCERCGRVAEVPVCVLGDATARVHSLTGFKVTSHRVVFGGLCRECASS